MRRWIAVNIGVGLLLANVMVTGHGYAMQAPASVPLIAPVTPPVITKVQSAQAAPTNGVPQPVLQSSIASLVATADPSAGEAYAKKVCAACHSLNEGGKAIVGPNLYGVVGGPHAHMPGFNYSDALKSKQGPWTYDELYAWLTKPNDYAPGTRMAFPGIKNDKLRLDVIAYLRTLSHDPEPLPEAAAAQQVPVAPSQ
jgi:cytochrome c